MRRVVLYPAHWRDIGSGLLLLARPVYRSPEMKPRTLDGVDLSHNSLTDNGCPPVKEKREMVDEVWARAGDAATFDARASPGAAS